MDADTEGELDEGSPQGCFAAGPFLACCYATAAVVVWAVIQLLKHTGASR